MNCPMGTQRSQPSTGLSLLLNLNPSCLAVWGASTSAELTASLNMTDAGSTLGTGSAKHYLGPYSALKPHTECL